MTNPLDCPSCTYHDPRLGESLEDAPEQCWTCSDPRYGGHSHYKARGITQAIPVPELPLKGLVLSDPRSPAKEASDGSSADYYKLPAGASSLQDLISHRNMNAQVGEIFRACYRYGRVAHSPEVRDIKKIIFYAQAELKRLESLA